MPWCGPDGARGAGRCRAALEELVDVGRDRRLHVDGDARALASLAPALLRADHAPLLHDPPAARAAAAHCMPGDCHISADCKPRLRYHAPVRTQRSTSDDLTVWQCSFIVHA